MLTVSMFRGMSVNTGRNMVYKSFTRFISVVNFILTLLFIPLNFPLYDDSKAFNAT